MNDVLFCALEIFVINVKGEINPLRVHRNMRGCIFDVNPKGLG